MKTTLLFSLIAACASAQEQPTVHIMTNTASGVRVASGEMMGVGQALGSSVKGAPYSATIITETVQTLSDGNRIAQKNEGAVARDSQGRMRHETILPLIGNMSTKGPSPKLVFINDPLAGVTYNLNVGEKTYRKEAVHITEIMKTDGRDVGGEAGLTTIKKEAEHKAMAAGHTGNIMFTEATRVPAPPPGAGMEIRMDAAAGGLVGMKMRAENMAFKNESLGSKVIEGVMVEGTRSTRTIPAGEVGNEKPIEIVSESWFSPELKTVVYSKRSDPRSGDMIYSLTNISRAEPDSALFSVPGDYKPAAEGPSKTLTYTVRDN